MDCGPLAGNPITAVPCGSVSGIPLCHNLDGSTRGDSLQKTKIVDANGLDKVYWMDETTYGDFIDNWVLYELLRLVGAA